MSETLALAFLGHCVGDYLLQNDWMALNKKSDSEICAIHAGIWALSVQLFTGWGAFWFIPLFVTHFIQDRTNIIAWYMDTVGQKQFRTGVCAPWSTIVVDNVWHLITIYIVWSFI